MRPLLLAVLLVPVAGAAGIPGSGEDQDSCRSHTISAVVGVNSGGDVTFCVRHPDTVRAGATLRLTATATSPALQGSNPTLTLTLNGLNGCTSAGATTHNTPATSPQGASATTVWTLVAGMRCTAYARLVVTSGAATVSDMALAINVDTASTWADELAPFALLVWLGYFVATRFIRGPYAVYLRILADVVAIGLLALPMPEAQWSRLAAAIYLVLIVDLFILLERPHGTV